MCSFRALYSLALAFLCTDSSAFLPSPKAHLTDPVKGCGLRLVENKEAVFCRHTTRSLMSAVSPTPESWTKKRLHNNPSFRAASLLSIVLAVGFSSKSPLKMIPGQAGASLHVLSFAFWFGMVAYTTFIAGITMFNFLPRKMFGRLQAKLFPKYFAVSSMALCLQLITLKSLTQMAGAAAHTSAKSLAVALVMTLMNQFYLEPVSTRNMLGRHKLEDDGNREGDEYKELAKQFGKFHGLSSLANLVALCAGVAHACLLGKTLVV